jgi:uncharacterized LabA/DUF88 family protein
VSKNVAVFVDVANIFYAAKAAGVDIDYVTLLKSATAGRDLVRAYAYTGLDPDNENQRNFHDFLRRHGYKVVSKDIRKYGDGKVKANLDIELVVDMMKTARNLDIAIVISGDGDFAPAIRAVQEMGVRVEVISFRGNTSSDLIDVADQFSDIAALAKVEKGSSRSGRRVSGDDEDLSMTAVPEKQSEGAGTTRGRGGRGRGRSRVAEPETVAASDNGGRPAADGGTIVALPGEKLSGARRRGARPVDAEPAEAAEATEVVAADGSNGDALAEGEDGQRRRRRRRGGRGRGRGRELQPTGSEPTDEGPDDVEDDGETVADARPARANSTFGSIWDSQLGVSPARGGATPSRRTEADVDDLDEPPIPEYLIAERRGRGAQGGQGGRGRGAPRGRGAYAAALDRERYGGGRGGGGGTRYSEPPRRDVGRGRQDFRDVRDARPPRGAGDEPWSEVPPELEAMLRAQIQARRPAAGAGSRAETPPSQESAESEAPAAATSRRRTTTRSTSRTKATAAADSTAEAPPKPTRARSRSKAALEAAPDAAVGESEATAAPKRRTTRKAASTSEATTPKRRTTRKAATTDAE